jgi:glycosyltransferase involved in cell wall biosynthesis
MICSAQMSLSISVVIPYFNGSRFIGEALASIREQTLSPIEIIIVDDASRPEEAEALDRTAAGCVIVHLPRNRGPSVARNVGIARARGDWIAFLDCDDLWDPHKLERQAAVVADHPGCRAVHCDIQNVLPDGQAEIHTKDDVSFDDFLIFPCPIFPSAVLMERQALFESGLFDPTKRCCEDLDLFLRFCHGGQKFHAAPGALVVRRVQPDGLSRNITAFWREADRVYRNYLSVFSDEKRSREALRTVHVDMTLRAVYARDWPLLRRMLGRATRRDVPLTLVLWRVLRRVVANRLQARKSV